MMKYYCRIELPGKQPEEIYDLLHAAMLEIGFDRKAVNGTGKVFNLPHATYLGLSTYDIEVVESVVRRVAHGVRPDALILVIQAMDDRGWLRLTNPPPVMPFSLPTRPASSKAASLLDLLMKPEPPKLPPFTGFT